MVSAHICACIHTYMAEKEIYMYIWIYKYIYIYIYNRGIGRGDVVVLGGTSTQT